MPSKFRTLVDTVLLAMCRLCVLIVAVFAIPRVAYFNPTLVWAVIGMVMTGVLGSNFAAKELKDTGKISW